jgi:hypothetical protein
MLCLIPNKYYKAKLQNVPLTHLAVPMTATASRERAKCWFYFISNRRTITWREFFSYGWVDAVVAGGRVQSRRVAIFNVVVNDKSALGGVLYRRNMSSGIGTGEMWHSFWRRGVEWQAMRLNGIEAIEIIILYGEMSKARRIVVAILCACETWRILF